MIGSHFQEILLVSLLTVLVGVPYVFYLRWYVPRQDRLGFEKAEAEFERRRREEEAGIPPSPADYNYAIAFDSQGLTVTNIRGKKPEAIARSWSSICVVTAFKRDEFTVDCICLYLGDADGLGVELDEEMAGWNRFVEALPMHLPGCKPHLEWFSAVAFPAFAPNPTEVYSRSSVNGGQ
jgi:hypothetical protein